MIGKILKFGILINKKEAWSKERDRLKELFETATEEQKASLSQEIKDLNKKGEQLEAEGEELKQATEKQMEKKE